MARRRPTPDLSTVESMRNDLAPEEFPEGPYGAASESPSLGKSEPWRPEQRASSAFAYENRELHENLPRGYPGEDPIPEQPDADGPTDAV